MERQSFCLNFGATKFQEKYELKKPFKPLFKKSNFDYEMRLYTAKHIESGEICAIKEVTCEKENYIDYAWKEVETVIKLRNHKCQNLIKYYEAFLYDFVDSEGIEMQGVKIVMELGDYPLSDKLQEGLEEKDAYEKIKETLNALENLKSYGIQHRDIKPSNLVVKDSVLKVIDLDACKLTNKFETQTITDKIGTKIYMDPCLTNLDYDDEEQLKLNVEKADLFSLGLTFLQLCRRMGAVEYSKFQQKATLYYCDNQQDKYEQLLDSQFSKIKNLKLKEFLQNVLRFKTSDRWDLNKCLQEVTDKEILEGYDIEIVIKSKEDYENFLNQIEQMEEGRKFVQSVSVQFGSQYTYQALAFQKIQELFQQKVEKLKILYQGLPNFETLTQLLGKLQKLKMLELGFSHALNNDSYEKLIQSIQKSTKLSHLNLRFLDQKIGENGASKLVDGLKSLQNISHLDLNLCSNGIGENGTSKLADGLKSLQNLSHLKLNLEQNRIGENGASKLAYGLKSLQNLSHLELNLWDNYIGENGASKLANGLKSLKNLSHLGLNLYDNGIGENGVSKLADSLKFLQNLSHLDLYLLDNGIRENGASKLADSLKYLQNLSHLDLNLKWNGIGENGVSKLADGLKSLQNLSHLDLNLWDNYIGENGASKLANCLKSLQNLSHLGLYLMDNGIGENGASKLVDGLKCLQNLSHLDLYLEDKGIGDNGASKFADGLKSLQNLSLIRVDLEGIEI